MLRTRIIPSLLIQNNGLVKTKGFSNPKYVGDPINAVRIFNEKEVDELVIFNIDITERNKSPNFDLIKKLAAECRMPLCYGGGVRSIKDAQKLVGLGVEKIAIGASVFENPNLINEMSSVLGAQSVVCVLDVMNRKKLFTNKYEIFIRNAKISKGSDFESVIKDSQNRGAGEIVFNSIDRDGSMDGYDIEFVKYIKKYLKIPATFLGGCGSLDHIQELQNTWGTVGASAGSFFVFKGKFRAVLISYPAKEERENVVYNSKNE